MSHFELFQSNFLNKVCPTSKVSGAQIPAAIKFYLNFDHFNRQHPSPPDNIFYLMRDSLQLLVNLKLLILKPLSGNPVGCKYFCGFRKLCKKTENLIALETDISWIQFSFSSLTHLCQSLTFQVTPPFVHFCTGSNTPMICPISSDTSQILQPTGEV